MSNMLLIVHYMAEETQESIYCVGVSIDILFKLSLAKLLESNIFSGKKIKIKFFTPTKYYLEYQK